MIEILEYAICIIFGFAIIFIIEDIRATKKYNKKLEKRIGRAKMYIHKHSCGNLKLTWGNEILDILDGKDEILGDKE